jgi:type II secretory pathway pseudopilin PulG
MNASSTPPDDLPESWIDRLRSQEGFGLVETLTAAIMVTILAAGTFTAVQSMTKAGAQERTRATGHAVAQADQSRMRNLKVDQLANYSETRTVTDGGTEFEVKSSAQYVSDATGTASCAEGDASADYIRISSSVEWPSISTRPPVLLQSTISPPNGSISPNSGALAVRVEDAAGNGLEGIGISGTGATPFTGATNELGCVIFGNLVSGNYQLLASTSGLVDRDGNPPVAKTTSVIPFATNVVVLQYDQPGAIDVDFTTNLTGTPQPSSADSVIVFNTGMSGERIEGTVGSPVASITIPSLFPFSSPDAVYAGACVGNNPNPTGQDPPPASQASVLVQPGGTVAATVQLPALDVQVWDGRRSSNPGSPVPGAEIVVSDDNCDDGFGQPITRSFTANSQGELDDPGLPHSQYDLCASDGIVHRTRNYFDVLVEDLSGPTSIDIYLGRRWDPGPC